MDYGSWPEGRHADGAAYGERRLPTRRLMTLTFPPGSLLAAGDVELDLLSFFEDAVTTTGDRAEVHEHVRPALHRDGAVALITASTASTSAWNPMQAGIRAAARRTWSRRTCRLPASAAEHSGRDHPEHSICEAYAMIDPKPTFAPNGGYWRG